MATDYMKVAAREARPSSEVGSRPPKQRFVLLDGMRGVAALAVALFHFTHLASRGEHSPNGVIAVDFFFCLSGFVIAYAHDQQLREASLGRGRFMALRLLRVAPMVWLGTLVGSATLPFYHNDWLSHGNAVVPAILLSLLSLPWYADGQAWWVDGVFWSLAAEIVANAIYAAVGRRLSDTMLGVTIMVSAGIFIAAGYHQPPSDGLFKTVAAFPYAVTRATSTFFIGIALLRIWRLQLVRPRVPWFVPVALLMLMLGWSRHGIIMQGFNTLAIFTLVPLTVYLGACVELRRPWIAEALGAASFPLYALHLPILAPIGPWVGHLPHLTGGLLVFGLPVALLLGSLVVARTFDEPVRQWLRRRLFAPRAIAA